jgi:predicted nucleic-acid-binding protein
VVGLDTNVLVRFLLRDDRRQAEAARAAIAGAVASGTPILVSLLTLLETEWVLRARAGIGKRGVIALFKMLLEARDIVFDQEEVVEEALYTFENGRADFAECLMAAHYRRLGCDAMLTFDMKAAKLPGGRLLTPA